MTKDGLDAVPTPALLLDRSALARNIATMSEWAAGRVDVRPHTKIHKCPEIARMQLAAGATGVTTATVPEAAVMVEAAVEDVLIANEVVGAAKLSVAAALAKRARLTVAVDDAANAEALSEAALAADAEIGVLLDVDVGMRRAGVRDLEAARSLARRIAELPGLRLRGVMGYEGHAVLEPDRERRAQLAADAMDQLTGVVEQLEADGLPIEVVSAGGTNTFDMTGAHPRVTELQAGTYALMDATYAQLQPAFEPALSVLATVVSRQGDTAVLDSGTKSLAVDVGKPELREVRAAVREIHEEHTLLDVGSPDALAVGDRVQLVVGYCGGTTNLHDRYHVVDEGDVVDTWSILARGPGWAAED